MARIEQGNGLHSAESSTSLRSTTKNLTADHGEEDNSLGSDSEVNGYANSGERQTDRYGFLRDGEQCPDES